MSNDSQPKPIKINQWPFRVKTPTDTQSKPRVMILLHGHQGNENVMWILTKSLPENYYLLAPRAPQQVGPEQYSWHEISNQWPRLQAYQELTAQLLTHVDQWVQEQNLKPREYDLMGFSQGAVIAYALALLHPERIGKVAALAGFIPTNWRDQLNPSFLSGKAFFVAHGTQDEIIPISRAEKAADWLQENGAQVTLCTADIGHKLSANCFSGLGAFFT